MSFSVSDSKACEKQKPGARGDSDRGRQRDVEVRYYGPRQEGHDMQTTLPRCWWATNWCVSETLPSKVCHGPGAP